MFTGYGNGAGWGMEKALKQPFSYGGPGTHKLDELRVLLSHCFCLFVCFVNLTKRPIQLLPCDLLTQWLE